MKRSALHIILIMLSCLPCVLLMLDLRRDYAHDTPLIDIDAVDFILVIVLLILPLLVLYRVGVEWRRHPQ